MSFNREERSKLFPGSFQELDFEHTVLESALESVVGKFRRHLQIIKLDEEVVRHLRQRLGVLLVRDNVAMLCARTPTFPPAAVDGEDDI